MARRSAAARLVLFSLILSVSAPEGLSAEQASSPSLLAQSAAAYKKGSKKRSDFLAARYLGLCHRDETACDPLEWESFVKERKWTPKAFVSSSWDPGFLEWFEKSIRDRWGVEAERVREKYRSFEIAQETYDKKYFVTAVAYPDLELWYTLEKGIVAKPLVLAMGSAKDRPTIYFGRTFKGAASMQFTPLTLRTQNRQLHYFYRPLFRDIDSDGIPEVWLRYNLSWGNGFSQFLEVYRIKDDRELVFLHRFEGLEEGYARLLDDGRVETARGVSSKGSSARADLDQSRVSLWRYQDGAFVQDAEDRTAPLAPLTPGWADIYLER